MRLFRYTRHIEYEVLVGMDISSKLSRLGGSIRDTGLPVAGAANDAISLVNSECILFGALRSHGMLGNQGTM